MKERTAVKPIFAHASADAPQIGVEIVTPQDAARLLGTMTGNRPLRTRHVRRYAREMVAGKWLLNGESIKITKGGRLIDGQHRLHAVMMAQKPVRMYVVRGVDDEAMITLDTGVGRSYHDVVVIRGEQQSTGVGPIARWWHKYETGSPATATNVPTHQEIDAIVHSHSSIVESAAFLHKLKVVRTRCTASVQGFVHAYASEKYDRELADLFMQDLNDGAGLNKTNPVYALRRRLVDDDAKGRLHATYVLALTIKAWNAWQAGEQLSALKWTTSGDKPEDFPRFSVDAQPSRFTRYQKRKKAARNSRPSGDDLRESGAR